MSALLSNKERVERNCAPEPMSGCWLWTGALDKKGYGIIQFNRLTRRWKMLAHRASYEAFVGPIPDGKFVCHSCDVPSCVNPSHLWLGTTQQNTSDRVTKGRSAKGAAIASSTLNVEIVRQIRDATGTSPAIGKKFGISKTHVRRIKSRESWAHV